MKSTTKGNSADTAKKPARRPPRPSRPAWKAPKLRTLSHPLGDQPRHRAAWAVGPEHFVSAEVFTEAQWALLHSSEQSESARLVPGLGWVVLENVELDEAQEIERERRERVEEYDALRGLTGTERRHPR